MLEPLEPRQLRSGTVTVTTDYGPNHVVLITGDAEPNAVQYTAGFNNSMEEENPTNGLAVYGGRLIVDGVEISGGKRTNPSISNVGTNAVAIFSSAIIDLGGGDDSVRLAGDPDNELGNVEILTGDGNDRVSADSDFSGSLKINTGTGNDRVSLVSDLAPRTGDPFFRGFSGVRGDLNIFTGPGRDRVTLDSHDTFRIVGKLRIADNSGTLQLGMRAVRAKGGVTISTGNTADYLSFNACYFSSGTTFLTRGGDDVITLRKTGFVQDQDEVFLTGSGYDRIEYL